MSTTDDEARGENAAGTLNSTEGGDAVSEEGTLADDVSEDEEDEDEEDDGDADVSAAE